VIVGAATQLPAKPAFVLPDRCIVNAGDATAYWAALWYPSRFPKTPKKCWSTSLAMRFGITASQIRQNVYAYPTFFSDIRYMLGHA
jgi:hypothetical protein